VTYSYDNSNQLTGDGTNTFTYDGTGNRSSDTITTGNQLDHDGTWFYAFHSDTLPFDDGRRIGVGANDALGRSCVKVIDIAPWKRALLLNLINSALHQKELLIGDFPLRKELQAELESFSVKHSDTGRSTFKGGTKAGHADMAMSAAMALWLSDHRTVGAHIGENRLKGYWD